jgi:glycine dehydrogenase
MLKLLGLNDLEALTQKTVPSQIRTHEPLKLPPARGEFELLNDLREIAQRNKVYRSYIGMGYSDCIVPPVIQRNLLENPGWYTQYTPYQAEISQGRLESLLNFQTMVADLTALPIANASLLDEATAAAEAMHLCFAVKGSETKNAFFVSELCHPQTIAVVQTRARPLEIEVVVGSHEGQKDWSKFFGALFQYPATYGDVIDYRETIEAVHRGDALAAVATDLLALTLLTPPGEFGADIAIGSAQRFGVPLGFGGPHAAFFSTRTITSGRCPAGWWGYRGMRMAARVIDWRCRRESNTSAARKPQATSAQRRLCWRTWRRCLPFTTARRA